MCWNENICIGLVLECNVPRECTCIVKRKHSASAGLTMRMLLTEMDTSRPMNLVYMCVFIIQCACLGRITYPYIYIRIHHC